MQCGGKKFVCTEKYCKNSRRCRNSRRHRCGHRGRGRRKGGGGVRNPTGQRVHPADGNQGGDRRQNGGDRQRDPGRFQPDRRGHREPDRRNVSGHFCVWRQRRRRQDPGNCGKIGGGGKCHHHRQRKPAFCSNKGLRRHIGGGRAKSGGSGVRYRPAGPDFFPGTGCQHGQGDSNGQYNGRTTRRTFRSHGHTYRSDRKHVRSRYPITRRRKGIFSSR